MGSSHLSKSEILKLRKTIVSSNVSISFQSDPLHIVRGQGQYLYDADGTEYLDCVNNVAHVGHSHPDVVKAVQEQISLVNTNTRYLNEKLVLYAQELLSTLPASLCVCFFVCSGSEANDLALRLASTHTGADDVIVLDHAYHGHTISCIQLSPYKFNRKGGTGKPAHVHVVTLPDGYRGPYKHDDPAVAEKYAAHVKDLLDNLAAQKKGLSAFIAESIPGCGGQVVLPPGYLAKAYEHVRAAGGVCIADEVQVGFGRVGTHFWAFETQGVVPDIVTLGKPIGNGFPMAAVVTTREIADNFHNGMEYFNTFGGCNVSTAVGLAVLDVIRKEQLQQNALYVGAHFLSRLQALKKKHRLIGEARGMGLFLGVELVRDPHTLEPATNEASFVIRKLKQLGIQLSTDGPLDNVLKIKPPMCFTLQNADTVCDALDKIFEYLEGKTVSSEGIVCLGSAKATSVKPNMNEADLVFLAEKVFNLSVQKISPLPSYDDQNFLIQGTTEADQFVLKISNSEEVPANLVLQNKTMNHLFESGIQCQQVLKGELGETMVCFNGHLVRCVRYLPGKVFATLDQVSPELLFDLGVQLAKMSTVLLTFTPDPAPSRTCIWDLKHALPVVTENLRYVSDTLQVAGRSQREVVTHFVRTYEVAVGPKNLLAGLKSSVIHGDVNDHNLLVTPDGSRIEGIIDFGDLVESLTLYDLAIGLAYAAMKGSDPLGSCKSVIQGYHSVLPLSSRELEVLLPLLCMRLCVSVTMSSKTLSERPDDPYIAVSQAGAWRVLSHFLTADFQHLHRELCEAVNVPL